MSQDPNTEVLLEPVEIDGVTYTPGDTPDGLPEEQINLLRSAGKIGKISPTGSVAT